MKKIRIITPAGRASFPHLFEKNSRFDSDPEKQRYECSVILKTEKAKELTDQIDAITEQAFQEALDALDTPAKKRQLRESVRTKPYVEERDDNDNLTGNIIVKARGKFQPGVFDAAGNVITADTKIGSGSTVQMSITAGWWALAGKCGLNLNLNAVRVIELIEWGNFASRSATEHGFDTDGDGFTVDDEGDSTGSEETPVGGKGDF